MTNLTEQYRELEQDFFAYQKMLNEANKDLNKYCLENTKLKELLKEWLLFEKEENPHDFTIMSERMEELAKQSKELLGEDR